MTSTSLIILLSLCLMLSVVLEWNYGVWLCAGGLIGATWDWYAHTGE
jgi:hypothetical protein